MIFGSVGKGRFKNSDWGGVISWSTSNKRVINIIYNEIHLFRICPASWDQSHKRDHPQIPITRKFLYFLCGGQNSKIWGWGKMKDVWG